MRTMLVAATNTRFFLSGHLDSEFPVFMHHGNVLEAVGTSLLNYPRVGVVTFDNSRAAYHTVELSNEKIILLTCPVPVTQISGRDVFNQQNFSVRALVFGNDNVSLYVDGSIEGKLKKQRMVGPNVSLWALPCIGLPYGKHKIRMFGDWNGECEFIIGNTMPGFNELDYLNEGNAENQFLFVWFFLFAIVIALPVNVRGISDHFDKSGQPKNASWLTILFGFLLIKRRIKQMPKLFQIIFFLATLWPIGLPIAFFSSESLIGMTWLYGYVCGWKQFPLAISGLLAFSYLGLVITPIGLIASSFIATKFKHPIVIVDLIVYGGGIGGNAWILYVLVQELGLAVGLTSPCFLIIPIILHSLLWFFIVHIVFLSAPVNEDPFL
jgi:hypothetical protein